MNQNYPITAKIPIGIIILRTVNIAILPVILELIKLGTMVIKRG
ncbi:MAG: hypothetical protein R3Y52_03450 [Psittacicella sp.]